MRRLQPKLRLLLFTDVLQASVGDPVSGIFAVRPAVEVEAGDVMHHFRAGKCISVHLENFHLPHLPAAPGSSRRVQ